MSEKEEKLYPAFGWDTQRYSAAKHEKPTKERLEWIHGNLPLTLAERDSLVYAAKNSELQVLGNDYLESLLQIENQSTIMEKKGARNPNRRQRHIRFQAPAPGAVLPDESIFAAETPRRVPMSRAARIAQESARVRASLNFTTAGSSPPSFVVEDGPLPPPPTTPER